MRKFAQRTARAEAFTLVELMIVVTIVAILALIAIPLYSANTVNAVMSEGVSGVGAIRSALRVYCSQNGGSYLGATMNNLPLGAADLEGKYFAQSDYNLGTTADSTYLITAGPPSKTTKTAKTYSVDQDGVEHGTYFSGH